MNSIVNIIKAVTACVVVLDFCVAFYVFCIIMMSTGCIGHMARGIGDSYSTISGAKDRDHAQTHGSREETVVREKVEEYTDKYARCIDENKGRSEPCKGYADLVSTYSATVDRGNASAGMDPTVKAILYENASVGRWEDWGQNQTLNRHEREIARNTGMTRALAEDMEKIWVSLDEIEEKFMEWDETYDASRDADHDALIDELDKLTDQINMVNGGQSADGQKMLERISRLERELQVMKGGK